MIGDRVGPYVIDRELGAGGMGRVYAATGPAGPVALKVVHPHLLAMPGSRERFEREARSGQAIAHPNVVRTFECLDVVQDGVNVPVLVLEYVVGRSLEDLRHEVGRVPEDLCRHLGREIARGLDAVHAAGIVHRDLKPGNVLLTATGDVKVMDLGLARQASGEDRMSQTGMFMGTAAYAPPEQFFGKKDLDPRSDLYSLGAMLFELATGRVPFQAEAIGDLVRQVLRDKAPRIGVLAPQTTPFFEEVVATLLEKDPDRRFASAADVAEVLQDGEAADWWAAASVRRQTETRKPMRRVRVQRETEIWGREDDLSELHSLWDRAKRGAGEVVLVEGEAGIGKTRLVEEFLAAIEGESDVAAQVLVGRHDPAGAAAQALAAAFRDHLGADDLDARLSELLPETASLVPSFAALLRGEAPPDDAPRLTADAIRTLFVQLARNLSQEAPLVLVVDDLHFATDDGRALFRALALAVEGYPVLLVGTARPGLPANWVEGIASRGNVTRHEVRRLDEGTVRTALTRHLGATHDAQSVAGSIAAQAGGNPYFVVEAIRHLADRGHLTRTDDGAWRVSSVPAELALPPTVRELVERRLAALLPADRELFEAAACQGHEFDGRLVAETLGRPRMDVLRGLGRLELTTHLVRAAGVRFAFDHHVVHEVLYAGQADDARMRRHGAVAAALESRHGAATANPATLDGAVCADLVRHLLRSADAPRALRYLDRALAHLSARYLTDAAIALAEGALAVPGLLAGAARADLLLRHCHTLDIAGRRVRQEECALEAGRLADEANDVSLRCRAASALGLVFVSTTRPREAEATYHRMLDLARTHGDRAAEAAATIGLGTTVDALGRSAEAQELFARHTVLARELGDVSAEAASTINLGNVFLSQGRLEEAQAQHERGLALARACGNRRWETNASANLAEVFRLRGHAAEAKERFERHLALSRELGDRRFQSFAHGILGVIALSIGRLAEACEHFERATSIRRETGDRRMEALMRSNLGVALAELDRADEARDHLVRGWDVLVEIGSSPDAQWNLPALVGIEVRGGRPDEARALVAERIELARRIGEGVSEALALASATRLPGADVAAAESAYAAHAPRIEVRARSEAALFLYRATGRAAYLSEARRLFEESTAHFSGEDRAAALANLRVNREIAEACREAGI
ncbi:MAG: protein kinase [Planctomycetes bacterium]|nr:protein kinase [Planctomycetota bacterium]